MQQINDSLATLRAGGIAVYPLLALAVVLAIIIIEKTFLTLTRTALPRDLRRQLEGSVLDWDALLRRIDSLGAAHHFARFLGVIMEHRTQPVWLIESRAAEAAALIERAQARWLWVLETIVTAAPLLGLLGTITGMIRAFRLFGNQGLVDPSGVTGGVAEALIATALGLFVALVALFAYNYFSDRQARMLDEMERLGTRLIDRIRLDGETARS